MITTNRVHHLLLALAVFSLGRHASAGAVDSVRPVLSTGGAAAKHVFSVTGVIKNNNLDTAFICTSLEANITAKVAVETFSAEGGSPLNDVSAATGNGVVTLGPGMTGTIGTGATAGVHEDEVINFRKCFGGSNAGALCTLSTDCNSNQCSQLRCSGGSAPGSVCVVDGDCAGGGTCAPALRNGSARIVSESTHITCTAFLVDTISSPPASMATLKVIKAKKQSGD